MWRTLQVKANVRQPLQLILDMKVRWSSTYLMLDHAERNKEVHHNGLIITSSGTHHDNLQHINNFIDKLCWEETDSAKRAKLRELKLSCEEWEQVNVFLGLLSVSLISFIFTVLNYI
jgi:hypothetical protein